jgi:putative inorganic carbon (hco3(-)) transporter
MRRRAPWAPVPRRQAAAAAAHVPGTAQADAWFYDLTPKKLWAYVTTQPPSFWFLVFYLFFEYVRPQAVYSIIDGWPFAFWCLLACVVSLVVEGGAGRRTWTLADTALTVFTGVVLLSSLNAVNPAVAFANIRDYLNWVVIYFLITSIVNTERRFLVFVLAFLLYSTKMSQFGFRAWISSGFVPGSYGVSCGQGFFQNSGECGVQMSVFFPMALFFVLGLKPYLSRGKFLLVCFMPFSALVTIVGSSSRGSMVALAAILVWLVARKPQNIKALVGVALVAGLTWLIIPEKQKTRFSEMGEDPTSLRRLQYWEDARTIMSEYPVLGIGYYNWLPYYRTRFDPTGQLPHNIFYQAGAELGFTGLGAFIGLILATFWVNRKTRRLARQLPDGGRFLSGMASGLDGAVIGFCVAGYFVTVLYYPFFWINLAFTTALHCSTVREVRRHTTPQSTQVRRRGSGPAPVAR